MTLLSPTAAVTDLLLGLIALTLGWRCRVHAVHSGSRRLRWYTLAYVALGVGAVVGFVTLGFRTGLERPLFLLSRFAIGLAVLVMLIAVVEGLAGPVRARPWRLLFTMAFAAYYVATLLSSNFLIFIGYSGTALVATLVLEAFRFAVRREADAGWMAAGMAVSILAAVLQALKLSFTLVWLFDHNAIYHLVHGMALLLLYRGVRPAGSKSNVTTRSQSA